MQFGFFRIQQNSDTKSRQLDLWCNLVLAYYKQKKLYVFDVNEIQTSPLFFNKEINSILFANCCIECLFCTQSMCSSLFEIDSLSHRFNDGELLIVTLCWGC